jgi:hypothetical protein
MTRRSASAVHRLGRWLVNRYPRPWRERYGEELLALLDDSGLRWGDILDLARALVVERARALIEPADHPTLAAAIIGVATYLQALVLAILAYGVAQVARAATGPLPARWSTIGQLIVAATLLASFVPIIAAYVRDPSKVSTGQVRVGGGTGWLMFILIGIGVVSWSRPDDLWLVVGWPPSLWIFLSMPWSFQRVQGAHLRLASANHEMKWALMERDRCELLLAQGKPAPLDEARANVSRIARAREQALADLGAMGYRAKFG